MPENVNDQLRGKPRNFSRIRAVLRDIVKGGCDQLPELYSVVFFRPHRSVFSRRTRGMSAG